VFAGDAGRAWEVFARETGMRVLSTDLDVQPPGGEDPGLGDVLQYLEDIEPLGRRWILARGPSLSRLAMGLHAGFEPRIAGLVQTTYLGPGARARALLPCPTLFVQVLGGAGQAPSDEPTEGGELTWIRRREPPLVVDLELPALVAAWLVEAR
jgi:hypothetical protein